MERRESVGGNRDELLRPGDPIVRNVAPSSGWGRRPGLEAKAVEARFDDVRTPHPVEWLSDNGPPYTASEARKFGRDTGLLVRTTQSYSPESNGMAEAFVKTLKRDYVYVNNVSDAASINHSLESYFADYNEHAPKKGLKI